MAHDSEEMAMQMNELSNDDFLYKRVSEGACQLYLKMTDWNGWKNTLKEILEIGA